MKQILSEVARILLLMAALLIAGCAERPVHGRQFLAAPPVRHTQQFETYLVSHEAQRCIVRTRLPEQRSPGSWIDERNSALRAAFETAKDCCAAPKLAVVEDWMLGFTAYEVTFICEQA